MSYSPEGGMWGNGDGRLLYPPQKSKPADVLITPPVTSIRFENLRDGIEDIEYMRLLKNSGPQGEKLLQEIHDQLVRTMTVYEQNPVLLMVARERIAGKIESLKSEK